MRRLLRIRVPTSPNPFFFVQGVGLNGQTNTTQQTIGCLFKANTLYNNYQTGCGLYWQDKWQLTPRITLTYGVRWDGTWNPQPQSAIPGKYVWIGEGLRASRSPVPQRVPDDFGQFGPRVGIAWNVGSTEHPTVVRAAWGLYYAQTPLIFFPTIGTSKQTTIFCPSRFIRPSVRPLQRFAPISSPRHCPSERAICVPASSGCPGISYVDPHLPQSACFKLHRHVEHSFTNSWTVSASYAFVHSSDLRTGGFSTTQWFRNFTPEGRTHSAERSSLALRHKRLLATPLLNSPLHSTHTV